MSEPTPQQKANLARIRDNQRRSRARRKEYLQELETKYRSCEAVGAEASAEIQAAARKVLDENKRLRRLLRQQGFSDAEIDGPDHDEFASSPSATEMLDAMLVTRKPCRPSSGSGCGDSQMCKVEDDTTSRRQSCASAPAASAHIAPEQQRPLQPIALAPAAVAVAQSPQSHEPLSQQQHHHQLQLQHQAPAQQPQHHVRPQPQPQPQQSMQYQSQSIQQQQLQPQPPQQQYYMTPPAQSSAAPVPHSNAQPSPNTFAQEYPLYAPQPYGFNVPASQLLDWDMASVNSMPQQGVYTSPADPAAYASPTSGYSTRDTFASPTPTASTGYAGQDNTSSCFVAAETIRAMNAGAGPEVESALGCRNGAGDCRVNNNVVFDIMDRYAGVQQDQQTGM